jgi:hypothetical protein
VLDDRQPATDFSWQLRFAHAGLLVLGDPDCQRCPSVLEIVADLLFEDEQPLSDWEPSHVKRIALHDQQTFTRRGPGDKGRVRWIHGRNPWTWT